MRRQQLLIKFTKQFSIEDVAMIFVKQIMAAYIALQCFYRYNINIQLIGENTLILPNVNFAVLINSSNAFGFLCTLRILR